MTDAAIEVEVHACVRTKNEGSFLEVQERLLLALLKAIEDAGAELPIPSQRTCAVRDRVLGSAGLPEAPGSAP